MLILVAFAPTLPLAIAFYLARMALSQMDVPTRQSYIVAVVEEDERTAAAGITNISRNIAQAVSPSLAGYILQSLSFLSTPFVLGGVLKIVYDIALYSNFKNKRIFGLIRLNPRRRSIQERGQLGCKDIYLFYSGRLCEKLGSLLSQRSSDTTRQMCLPA